MSLSTLAKKRIESIRSELNKGEITAISARHARRRNIAGEQAIEKLGKTKAGELLEKFDAGNDDAGLELVEACR